MVKGKKREKRKNQAWVFKGYHGFQPGSILIAAI